MREKIKPYLLLAPILTILLLIFVAGLAMALFQSIGYFPAVGLNELTLKYFRAILSDKGFLDSLAFSLYISLVSAGLATLFGVLSALALFKAGKDNSVIVALYRVPIIVPHLVSVLLVYNILSQSGILSRVLFGLGLISDQAQFPSLLYNQNGVGIIFAYLWKEIPFVALTAYTILNRMSSRLTEAARNLGASGRQTFLHITLPLIAPSVFSSFIILFAFSFGAYEVPYLLGPTTPKTLPVMAFIEHTNPVLQNRPYAMAINIIITLIALFLTWLYFKAFERINRYGK